MVYLRGADGAEEDKAECECGSTMLEPGMRYGRAPREMKGGRRGSEVRSKRGGKGRSPEASLGPFLETDAECAEAVAGINVGHGAESRVGCSVAVSTVGAEYLAIR